MKVANDFLLNFDIERIKILQTFEISFLLFDNDELIMLKYSYLMALLHTVFLWPYLMCIECKEYDYCCNGQQENISF